MRSLELELFHLVLCDLYQKVSLSRYACQSHNRRILSPVPGNSV
jgi:hypothetical protein